MHSYFLKSPRIGFGIWTADDLPLATDLWGDTEVTRYHGGPWSAEQIKARLDSELKDFEHHGVQYWPLFLLESGQHVGCCGIRPLRNTASEWELGCHLRRPYWSMRLGREAAQAVIAYGFDVLHIEALHAGHHPGNDASRRFLQHLGFRYTHDEFYAPTGLIEPRYRLMNVGSRPCEV